MKPALTAWLLALFITGGMAQQPVTNPHARVIAKWQAAIPKITSLLEKRGDKCPAPAENSKIEIVDAANFQDGISVALVNWCSGGAYTDWIEAMQLDGEEPVFAPFTKPNGKVDDVAFLQGASVMHGVDVKLDPEKNAIYGFHWDRDQKGAVSCAADAYVWNRKQRAFLRDVRLTKAISRNYCENLELEQ